MKNKISDWQDIEPYLKSFSQITRDFLSELNDKQVAKIGTKLKQQSVSNDGEGFAHALELLCDHIIPQLSASRGPRYWGFVTGGATPVASFADWLVTTFDQNVSNDGDSIATAIEHQTLSWLCQLFDLPSSFDGIMTTGATASNFLGALCARQYAGLQQNKDIAKEGVYQLKVDIFSTTPHASMLKSLGMSGLGQNSVTLINALPNSEAMDTEHLLQMLEQSSAPAKIIIASAATVTTTDFDDLQVISRLAKKYNAWLHVDAAFGLFERLVSGKESKSKGIEKADSITLDSHKWLNVPYESGVFLTRHLNLLFDSCHVPAPYLTTAFELTNFMSLGVENSRRFKALPVWMTLLVYGKKGITQWVKKNIKLAKYFANEIEKIEGYELVFPCQLNIVLFRPNCSGLSKQQANNKTKKFLQLINEDGRVFLSSGQWKGSNIIRAAFSNWQTQSLDVDIALECLNDIAKKN